MDFHKIDSFFSEKHNLLSFLKHPDLQGVQEEILDNYLGFEFWLDNIVDSLSCEKHVSALDFGLFETKNGIVIYTIGSDSWDLENDGWVSHISFVPNGNYLFLNALKYDFYCSSNINMPIHEFSLFLCFSFLHEYFTKKKNSFHFEKELHVAFGFDDGDLYNIGYILKNDFHYYRNF